MDKEEKQYLIEQVNTVSEIGEMSDGYHTFNSLYNQRLYLFAALVNAYKDKAWKSKCHHDGEPCFGGGWFLVGITTPAGDYTYHYELKDWDLFDCKVLDKAPVFDGHTDKDITRVMSLQPHSYPNWISVEDYEKDELPSLIDKEDQYGCSVSVLFVVNLDGINYINKGCFDYDTGVWHSIDTGLSYTKEQVTHWMSLPEVPRKEVDNDNK